LASLTDVERSTSGWGVLMTWVGGLGPGLGPVVGAFWLVALHRSLSQRGSWVIVVQGSIFVTPVLAFRLGMVGMSISTERGENIMTFIAIPVVFVILYYILMLPTYILPYFGSNSAVFGAASVASGAGVYPLFLLHLAFLIALIVLAYIRGKVIARK